MPALFSLGQHRALEAVQSHDIYLVCSPDRVWQIHEDLRTQLWTHAKVQMHKGKTQVWNRGGVASDGWERLDAEAQRSDHEAVVWRGTRCFPICTRSHGPWHSGGSLGLRQGQVGGVVHRASELVGKIQHIGDLQSGCCRCCSAPLHERTTHFGRCTRMPHSKSLHRVVGFVCWRHWPPRSCQKQARSLLVELG